MKVGMLVMTRIVAAGAIATLGYVATASAAGEITTAQIKSLYGSDLKVLGEVQSIDLARQVLVVAGQHVSVAKETTFSYNGTAIADHTIALHMLQPGDILAIN